MTETRRLLITDDLVRVYSRRGNFHSEAAEAGSLGLPGLVAQGTQVCGPAYGLLLDAWGEEFLAHGELELRFVGMVLGGHEVEAVVDIDATPDRPGAHAQIRVENLTAARTAAVGTASRTHVPRVPLTSDPRRGAS